MDLHEYKLIKDAFDRMFSNVSQHERERNSELGPKDKKLQTTLHMLKRAIKENIRRDQEETIQGDEEKIYCPGSHDYETTISIAV